MNLLLFESHERQSGNRLEVNGRRARHLIDVLRVKPGDSVRVGELSGAQGSAKISAVKEETVALELSELTEPASPAKPVSLIVALPRPQSVKKLLENAACFGVEKIIFINSARVEQSYFSSPVLRQENLRSHLLLGLEQAKSTALPTVDLFPAFRPTERGAQELDALRLLQRIVEMSDICAVGDGSAKQTLARLWQSTRSAPQARGVFAIGPEGGWLDFELSYWTKLGFTPVSLGERVLRVENAVTALLGQLDVLRELSERE